VRATHGEACLARTRRRRRSPGGGRRGVGNDQWVPLVSGSGRGSDGAGWRGFAGQLGRQCSAELSCEEERATGLVLGRLLRGAGLLGGLGGCGGLLGCAGRWAGWGRG
jgi:hypothetical protein